MIYLNNFMPLLLFHSAELDVFRLEAPLADVDTIQWDQKFLTGRLPASYRLERIIWVLNPRIFPPVPVGTAMFTVYQNDVFPFNTRYISWVAFPIMTNVIPGNFAFLAFKTSIPGSIPIGILNEDIKSRIISDQAMLSDYLLTTPFTDRIFNYDNFLIYVADSPKLFWRGTAECLCIPSDDPNDYDTLVACQKDVYKKIKNKTSYTANSAIPLAIIRDRLYPVPRQYHNVAVLVISILVFLLIAWIIYKKTTDIKKI